MFGATTFSLNSAKLKPTSTLRKWIIIMVSMFLQSRELSNCSGYLKITSVLLESVSAKDLHKLKVNNNRDFLVFLFVKNKYGQMIVVLSNKETGTRLLTQCNIPVFQII